MDFDLIGGPAGSGKPYAMFERGALRRYETIAKEADNPVNDIQARILERAFKTDPCCYSVLALVPPQLATASAVQVRAAQRTIEGYEAMHMIRKGQARWVSRDAVRQQNQFIDQLFDLAA